MAYSTIPKGSLYMNTKLYTGTGSSNAQTGVGFQPDWVWLKCRSADKNNNLYDAVRGATKEIYSNLTNAEDTDAQSLKSFDSNGFTVGTGTDQNDNGETFASWNWKAGTTSGITTNASTDTTPSSYSFNQTSGLSIVKYSGSGSTPTKIAHGLGVAPKMIIVKRLTGVADWVVGHDSMEWGKYIYLSSNAASVTAGGAAWENTAPDSINFTVGNNTQINASGSTYIAYCFADVKGFSKMGSYTGNGSTNGSFIYTGFKPAFVMVKQTNASGEDWFICDNRREGYNAENNRLLPNLSSAESTDSPIDILSNGFKARLSGANVNGNSSTYIYMAFAENPFVATSGTAALPVTAR